jgi:hypothetical protein
MSKTVTLADRRSHGVRYPFRGFDFGQRPAGLKSDPAAVIIDGRERERSGKKYGQGEGDAPQRCSGRL